MANSALVLTSLDFDTLKSQLKTFLQSQSQFKDYDYEGSNMNVLLDVLSYNTYLNSFYLNMMASETFLDTAQLYSSVVSHAKELNYTPRSARSAKATISCNFITTGISNTFSIPKGTQFSGQNANGSYTFVTDRTQTITSTNNVFSIATLDIYEGSYINETMIVDNTIENQRFVLSNKNIDTTSIVVTVSEDNGSIVSDFIESDTLYNLNSTSQIYFLQSTLDGYYEIVFGDGVFGRVPQNNALILVTYRVCSGSDGNGVKTFFLNKDLGAYNGGNSTAKIVPVSASSDGAPIEDIESIRFRAPRNYQTQDRAVTVTDYKTLILNNFTEIKDVNVYGGEEVSDSVQYGKVIIVPTTFSGSNLTNQRKTDVLTYLKSKKIIGIELVVSDPDYVYIVPSVSVNVNFNDTPMTPAEIKSSVVSAISNFNKKNLQIFNNTFRFSKLVEAVDATDFSILGNQITTQIYKILEPTLGVATSLTTKFNNALVPGTLTSTQFLLNDGNTYILTDYSELNNTFQRQITTNGFTVYNTNPVIYLKKITTNNTLTYLNAGTIDYNTGIVNIINITVIDFLNNAGISLTATPVDDDIKGTFNNIVEIDIGSVSVNVNAV